MIRQDEIERARSRWDLIAGEVILKRRGHALVGLCPFHNEKTPSFYVVPAKNFFHCFGCCAHGDVIAFMQRRYKTDFASAVHRINGSAPARPLDRQIVDRPPAATAGRNNAAEVAEVLRGCGPVVPGTAAYLYLRTRYLRTQQPALYAHPALPCWELGLDDHGAVRTLPALVAPFMDSSDRITAVQRIWLSDVAVFGDGRPHDNRAALKNRKKTLGHLGDGAVRLTPLGQVHGVLGLAEGIETAAAARTLLKYPVWAIGGIARFGSPGRAPPVWLPPWIKQVVVVGDNGDVGHRAAEYAADCWRRKGLAATAVFPESEFSDFNDQLIAKVDRREVVIAP